MIAVILLIFALCSISTGCPKSSFGYGDSCYNVVRVKASWPEAIAYCNGVGSQLAMVETAEEQTFLQALLANESEPVGNGVWIAGSDYIAEGDWQWSYPAGAIKDFFWAAHQPDDDHAEKGGQDCLMLNGYFDFKWDDNYCSEQFSFLCETREGRNP